MALCLRTASPSVADPDPNAAMNSRVGALAGLHVLVIEDDRDARDILTMVLQYFGAMITAVRRASDGLQVLRNISPDVVVADIQLPDHDARWVKRGALSRGIDVPFIAISANDYDPERLAEEGFDAYLRKPLDHGRLVDTILAVARSR